MNDEAPSLTRTWLPAVAAACTLVLWASAFVAIRHLGHDVKPGALTISRLGIASLVLGLMLTRRPWARPSRREWVLLVACGVMWFGIYNLALNEAERRIDAGTAAMLIQIGPLLVALLAALFLDEPLTRWIVAGLAVGFTGVAVIALASDSRGSHDPWGVGLTVLAAITYGIGVVTQKPLTRRLHPLQITFLACLIGMVTALPFGGELVDLAQDGSASTWLLIIYLGVFPTALAFTTWAFALTHMGAAKLAITTLLVPAIAIVMSWLLLNETPPTMAYVGGLLCVAGVLVSRRRPKPAIPTPVLTAPAQPARR